jgi:hypothetical protein
VGERFVLQARAGAGGAATVYRALDRQTGATCAVKIMTSLDPAGDERFEREARWPSWPIRRWSGTSRTASIRAAPATS